jgi:spore germination protein GerM
MKEPWNKRLILVAFLAIFLVFGALIARQLRQSPEPPGPKGSENLPRHDIVLYFGSDDGRQLVAETRQVEGCREESECLRQVVTALLSGPLNELTPLFPTHAVVRGVTLQEGTAVVDLSREAVDEHPGGSLSELLSVVGLANTLASNFPQVRGVSLLIEGQPVETLKGHLDLRRPIAADFALVRSAPGTVSGR